MLKPIFVILTSLSIIWDFQVFTQVWVMLDGHPGTDYYADVRVRYMNRSARASTGSARPSRW